MAAFVEIRFADDSLCKMVHYILRSVEKHASVFPVLSDLRTPCEAGNLSQG